MALATITAMTAAIAAQDNPRYARWKLKSEAPAPQSNIMTYEAHNGTGMKVTIDSVNRTGAESKWFYTTMFDGKDEPVTGRNGTATGSVKVITDRINEIVYKNAEGKITQILMNVLSPDGNTITVSYVSVDAQGNLRPPTYATYERMK
jgi:hypothetical protein